MIGLGSFFSSNDSLLDSLPPPDAVDNIDNSKPFLVMLTTGDEDGGKRATLAFSAACSSMAMESPTSVFLVGDGTHWAYTSNIKGVRVSGFPTLYELMEAFMDLGGTITICSTCSISGSCTITPGSAPREHIMPNIKQEGFTSVISVAKQGSSLTF